MRRPTVVSIAWAAFFRRPPGRENLSLGKVRAPDFGSVIPVSRVSLTSQVFSEIRSNWTRDRKVLSFRRSFPG